MVSVFIMGGSILLSEYYIGYDRAGNYYMTKMREKRKSLQPVSRDYFREYPDGISRRLRPGK